MSGLGEYLCGKRKTLRKLIRSTIRPILLSLAIIGIFFCQESLGAEGVLEGIVTDRSTGQPIAGATVIVGRGLLNDPSVTTDANGFYSLTGEQVGTTTGNLTVRAAGFFVNTKPFTVSTPILDIDLLPGGPLIQGTVHNAVTGLPIAGATVILSGLPSLPLQTISGSTDATGFYSIDSTNVLVLQRTFRARSRLQDVPPGEGIGVIWASPNSVRLKGSL